MDCLLCTWVVNLHPCRDTQVYINIYYIFQITIVEYIQTYLFYIYRRIYI